MDPAPLHVHLQHRFFESVSGGFEGALLPAFHGTSTENLPSIYKYGLMIPGLGNSLKVAHGSAHGLGIYAAAISNPEISWGFCTPGNAAMLVCGVLDDSLQKSRAELIAHLPVTAESENIRHVGVAIVAFEPSRIVPLFVASQCKPPRPTFAPLLESKKRRKCRGPRSSFHHPTTGHDADLARRRLVAVLGHSVALCSRSKARKKGVELLHSRTIRK